MRRLRRTRRFLKWGGLALSLIIVLAWMACRWWRLAYAIEHGPQAISRCTLEEGTFSFSRFWVGDSWREPTGWSLRAKPDPVEYRHFEWWLRTFSRSLPGSEVSVPLWMPFLLVAAPTMFLWLRDRRRVLPGHCGQCGYDLTGNTSGVCPECGMELARSGEASVPPIGTRE
jgi:hypothetical protein